MEQKGSGGIRQVTELEWSGRVYLYGKSQGINGDKVIIFIFPLEKGEQK